MYIYIYTRRIPPANTLKLYRGAACIIRSSRPLLPKTYGRVFCTRPIPSVYPKTTIRPFGRALGRPGLQTAPG